MRKWNTIEHRLFCHITANGRGQPLESREVVVSLIGANTSTKGLPIQATLDAGRYPTGVKVSDAEMTSLQIERSAFHGDWNSRSSASTPQIETSSSHLK